jgi:DNA-binding transcriptional MocR family regulator
MGPVTVVDRLIGSGLRCMGGGANPLIANALAHYCQGGLLEPQIEHLRQVYRRRRDVTLDALSAHMPASVDWTLPDGGVFTWLTLADPVRANSVASSARENGIMVLAGDPFFAQEPTGQHLRLAFSYVEPAQIQEGIERLSMVIRSQVAA